MQVDLLGDEFEKVTAASSQTTEAGGAAPRPCGAEADYGGGAHARRLGEGPGQILRRPDRPGPQSEIDHIVGRDAEIRQVIDILLRRRQNNPILAGEAGVGKTARGRGLRPAASSSGDVPAGARRTSTLRSLDIGLLQAGASVKGEFEKRLRQVIDEVESLAHARSSCSSTRPTP